MVAAFLFKRNNQGTKLKAYTYLPTFNFSSSFRLMVFTSKQGISISVCFFTTLFLIRWIFTVVQFGCLSKIESEISGQDGNLREICQNGFQGDLLKNITERFSIPKSYCYHRDPKSK